jgi:hypothetical protein
MSQEPLTAGRPISGDDIISEILRNGEAGQFKIRQTALLPSVYHVYLNAADYDTIRPVIPALTAEARSALIEKLDELNRRSRPLAITRALGFENAKAVEYKILDSDWTIEFHPDAEEKLAPGDIEIYSELASAPQPDFEGAQTRHVTRRRTTAAGPAFSSEEAPTVASARPSRQALARIRFQDSSGPQVFEMAKDQIVIGRGGKAFWVDLKLNAPPDVSREHCRIRRDPATGGFFLKDVSQFGTSIDGVRAPSSLEIHGGQERDNNIEIPLPPRATITLADVFTLEFEASG